MKLEFILSCDTFAGFRANIDIDPTDPYWEQKIVHNIYSQLKLLLSSNGLFLLSEKLESIKDKLHIHDNNIEDIINMDPIRPIYICNHCPKT